MSIEYKPEELNSLFNSAMEKDEFEFICTLLRVRGMESAGWDTLEESRVLITQLLSIIEAPIENTFKVRMLLLLYCHITEMNDLYSIVANLLRILDGERYSTDPFDYTLYEDRRAYSYPEGKVTRIVELSKKAGIDYIGDLYKFMLNKQIRNAFFHSSYTIFGDEFRIRGEGVEINGVITPAVPFNWLVSRITVAVNVAINIFDLIHEYRSSYTENKVIKGRLGPKGEYVDLMLTVSEYGLAGFKSLD